ncbi:MAG TPA: hypothetical protein QF564_07260 [Pirellulaceae bacterium]|nr:hypothetical protein [Pirellulaceae bacterium]
MSKQNRIELPISIELHTMTAAALGRLARAVEIEVRRRQAQPQHAATTLEEMSQRRQSQR